MLYAGTEHGVYVSFDDGARRYPFHQNMPDTQTPTSSPKRAHDVVVRATPAPPDRWGVSRERRALPADGARDPDVAAFTCSRAREANRSADRAAIATTFNRSTERVTIRDLPPRFCQVVRSLSRTAEEEKKAKDASNGAGRGEEEFFGPPRSSPPTSTPG